MVDVILRLKRVGGQVEGLIRMIEREAECAQIITQFQAAKAALDNTFSLVLQRNLKDCLSPVSYTHLTLPTIYSV